MRTLLAGAALAALVWTSASAQPVTLETMLALEELGRVQTDPMHRWLVAERRAPQTRWPSYDYGYEGSLRYGDLFAGELTARKALEPLLPLSPGVGYSAGPFSPDGRRLVVYRLTADEWRLGIVEMETRTVRWTGISPLIPIWGRTVEWLSETRLAVLGTPRGELPQGLRYPRSAPDLLPRLWARRTTGEASFVINETGQARSLAPVLSRAVLWSVDVASGAEASLAEGPFIDMEASPTGRTLALTVDRGPDRRPISGRVTEVRYHRALSLIDVETAEETLPALADDISPALLAWAPSGGDLLVYSRTMNAFLTVSPEGDAKALNLGSLTPWAPILDGADVQPQGAWVGGAPVVRAQASGSARIDWWRIGADGPTNLTGQLSTPGGILAQFDDGIAIVDGERVVTLDESAAIFVGNAAPRPSERLTVRAFTDAMKRDSATATHDGRLCTITGTKDRLCLTATTGNPLVIAAATDTLVTFTRSDTGVGELEAVTDGRRSVLLDVNEDLRSAEYSRPIRVQARGASGWLYLPDGSGPFPIIVIPYPERIYPQPPREMEPAARSAARSGAPLVAAGYAVLYPDVPGASDPIKDLAARLLAVIDAAADQHPAVDRDRIGLWGWSFGAWASVMATTQSDRFDAVVALNGPYDPLSVLGTTDGSARAEGRLQPWATDNARWLETGQARLGAPYWDDPEAYRRNSAVVQAQQITTPILLLSGDQDANVAQAELMFGALNRLGREAVLITYFGEDHGFFSPGNLRQMYAQTIGWFDRHLKGAEGATPGAIANGGTTPPSAPG